MSRAALVWKSRADGGEITPGALLRWREVKRGQYQYGYYRGVQNRAMAFSLTSDGPIFLWAFELGIGAQVATITTDSGSGVDS
ncbi:hypothetical protein QMG61_05330 [Cryobacterium sp. PH31-AA6]|uniref:hypothetical protein n=1 Tax=Cryobacterium sp. PH31-AA6 TaxID=3046205 RepID=UPI0024BB2E19|nr:hypothetical protein [Cryobacterium sp. PH31-AA6]MDJ0323184.1 hypothetical protein [Cryobacterium sp. PH31-AA6]